jgi:hypothetical protein
MMYGLLGVVGCVVNFSLFVGVGVFMMRNRRQNIYSPDKCDNDGDSNSNAYQVLSRAEN